MSHPEDRRDLERFARDHGWTVEQHGDTDAYIRPGVSVAVHFSALGHACGGDLNCTPVHAGDDVADWARYVLRERGERSVPAEEIHARYVEVIARRFYELDAADEAAAHGVEMLPWTQADKAGQTHSVRIDAQSAVDALAAAGLLPDGEEWAVRYEARRPTPTMEGKTCDTSTLTVDSEDHARAAIANGVPMRGQNRRVVSRPAFEWREVDHG